MKKTSVYLCYLLRHHPEEADLTMDRHGWVEVEELIREVNRRGKHRLDRETLEELVAQDEKGRYRFNDAHSRIKCCQGHSIPWVEPELVYGPPPRYLYHGTTTAALKKIEASGAIEKRKRHGVHLQPEEERAWQSARRWGLTPVVVKVDAGAMAEDGFSFGMAENEVWLTDVVPARYICDRLYFPTPQ